MAKKEMYRLDVVIGVNGDGEVKAKLKSTENFAEKTEKRLKNLNKIKVSPTVRLNDKTSSIIDKISRKSKLLNKVFTSTARINDRATPILDRLKGRVGIFNKPVDMLIRARDSTNSTISSIKAKVQNLVAASVISLNMKADPAIRAISLTRNKLGELSNKLSSFSSKTYQAIVKLKDNVSPTLQSLDNKINTFTKGVITKLGAIATAGAAAFGGIGVGSSLKTFAEFEKGLSNVKAVTGATDAEMKKLSDTAKDLGATTA